MLFLFVKTAMLAFMSAEKIFRFDRAVQKAVSWHLSGQKSFVMAADMRPEDMLRLFSPDFLGKCEESAGKQIPATQAIYYLLLEYRRFAPSFYPPHDICLVLANLAKAAGEDGRLFVLDPKVLPSAVLLAGKGWEIAFPAESRPLKEMLAACLKGITFMDLPEKPAKDAAVLAGDPRICLEEGKGELIREAESAICLANWDFLGVKSSESYRRYWMEKGGVSGILQLPRLKRQGSAAYPAIMRLNRDAPNEVRMARIGKVEIGVGALDQEQAISLMHGEPDGVNSKDIGKETINANQGCNLTPAVWLNAGNYLPKENGTNLGKYVQIIRCQLKRVKVANASETVYGQQPDGSFVVREVGMGALQSQCGILLESCGETVRIAFKRQNSQFKYLLRKNDLIFAFRGTTESLGKVGFVDSDPETPSITGTAFYLLRPLAGMNPVWLFWQLQSKEARNAILARSSGTTMLNISVDDMGSLPIRMPEQKELEQIMGLHSEMAQRATEISMAMLEIGQAMERMAKLIN